MKINPDIFKAYDVRGIYPDQLDQAAVRRIAEAYAAVVAPKKVAVGRDVRSSGKELKEVLIDSLLRAGIDVVDIGVITTDQLYFSVGKYGFDGGTSITASHNPAEYNGIKFSDAGGAPITSEKLTAIRDWATSDNQTKPADKGNLSSLNVVDDYVKKLLSLIDANNIKPLKIVANANFGAVGIGMDKIAGELGLTLERLNWEQDGSFPKGPPNPMLPENRIETSEMIKSVKPDLGVAWDADADRVFFFTGSGVFIPSCYIIALLAPEFLKAHPGSKIVYDTTMAWPIDDAIKQAGGIPVMNRTGHTFMKARMRQEDAPFAGESSGHYYFRDTFYADNGIIPLLMILQMVSQTGKSLDELMGPLMQKYKVSGEINFKVNNPAKAIELIEEQFGKQGKVDKTDGLIVEAAEWRFSVRASNTEPLFRLNAEAHHQAALDKLVQQVSALINT